MRTLRLERPEELADLIKAESDAFAGVVKEIGLAK